MSGSISAAAIGNGLFGNGSTSVAPSSAANGSTTGTAANAPPATDTVSLSTQARTMLAASTELAAFEAKWQSFQSQAQAAGIDYAGSLGALSTDAEGAVSVDLSSTEFEGTTFLNEVIDGSATADEVMNVSVFYNPQPSTIFTASVTVGNGNDTVNAITNAAMYISAGNGDDNINVTTSGPNGMAIVNVGSGNDTINLNGSGIAYAGSGNDVINLKYTGGPTVSDGVNRSGGNTVINGNGPGTSAYAGRGTTTINNVDDAEVAGIAGSTNTINLDNQAYSQVKIIAGLGATGGSTTINLSDPAAGVSDGTQPVAQTQIASISENGHRLNTVAADANGNYAGDYDSYLDVLPTEGQAGYGLAHTRLDFVGVTADQVTSALQGSTLTLTVSSTGETITVNNYQAGRVTFTFAGGSDDSDYMTASRQPPGLSQDGTPSA
jgi:hypothetical protein